MKQSRSLFSIYAVLLQPRNARMIFLGREVLCDSLRSSERADLPYWIHDWVLEMRGI